jgi:prepilin-type N-terminal cleavage/methylation domain-containing protein
MAVSSWLVLYLRRHSRRHWHRHRLTAAFSTQRGFTLVELLAGISLGVLISMVIIEALVAETGNSIRLTRVWRERAATLRVLEMMRGELAQAQLASPSVIGNAPQGCGLTSSTRTVILYMQTPQGIISYSLETNPSNIWRNTVLMRCGPDYDLNGSLSASSQPSSDVVLDGLLANGVTISQPTTRILLIEISQSFANSNSSSQPIVTRGYAAVKSFQ